MTFDVARGSADFKFGFSDPEQFRAWFATESNIIGVAFVGRSNVGKSSLINTIFGKATARVSKTPGRTQQINIFEFKLTKDNKPFSSEQKFFLFDVPGYGHADVSKEMKSRWNKLMGCFFEGVGSMVKIINLQDARHPHMASDQEFHVFLKDYPFDTSLAFNKIDKLKTQKERAALDKVKASLYQQYKWVKEIYFISAETGAGLKPMQASLVNHLINSSDYVAHSKSQLS